MRDLELRAGISFVHEVKNFLDNRQAKNYEELVEKPLKSLQDTGANMSIKVLFLLSHLDKFLGNCGDLSDEQGERFYQGIKTIEECEQGWWNKL